jgi:hypothetical protein
MRAKMKRACLSGIAFSGALVAGGCALAEDAESLFTRAMIRNIAFITGNSSLGYAGEALPEVTVLSDAELQRLHRLSETRVFADGTQAFARVSALYDRVENRIFLADVNAIDGPGLLHEMVHFLQNINGRDDMFRDHGVCLEAEAYDLQAIWQAEHRIDLASMPGYGFVMTLYGVCNDADFSWRKGAFGG